MEFFRGIRLSRGKAILRKRISKLKRKKFTGNIANARKIGIVWDAERIDEFPSLSQFCQKLTSEKNVELKIIGFYPANELPDKLTAVRYLSCLKVQDLDITYRPVSNEAQNFISTPYDILIDANFRRVFPLEYISSLSAAGFKVGIFDNGYENPPFDLMIEQGRNSDIGGYLNQVLHYLELINRNNPPK